MLDTINVLFEEGLRAFGGTEPLSPRDRFARTARLHMAIHGFVLRKYTKPDDEHHLQAPAVTSQTWFSIP